MKRFTFGLVVSIGVLLVPATVWADLPPLVYMGFGDSYSSGEGTFSYTPESSSNGNTCHQSPLAYGAFVKAPGQPDKSILEHINDGTGPPFIHRFYACSGAQTRHVESGGIPQQGSGPGSTPQVQAFLDEFPNHQFVPTLSAITIGGNDGGFAYVLTKCFFQGDCRTFEPVPNVSFGDWLRLRMDATRIDLADIYSELRGLGGSSATFVLAYPTPFAEIECGDLSAAFGALKLSADEQAFLNDIGTDLNRVLSDVAQQSGVFFVWNVDAGGFSGDSFSARRICNAQGDPPFINPLLTRLTGPPRSESIHPNTLGNKEYAEALNWFMRAVADTGAYAPQPFRVPFNPDLPGASSASPQQIAMAGGSMFSAFGDLEISHVTAPPCSAPKTFVPGEQIQVQGNGYSAGESVTVRVESINSYSTVVATVNASPSGGIDTTITIPTDIPVDVPALVEATALDAAGDGRVNFTTIGIGGSFAVDSDTDGIADLCDVCPAVADPGQDDDDGDGNGNACDPCPLDGEDDADGDGLCADLDPCPFSFDNDADGDGVCEDVDNCPSVSNPTQDDTDRDGFGDLCQPSAACDDDLDNDGDGLIDWDGGSGGGQPDPGCSSASEISERLAGLPCDDGIDNDGDTLADFPDDPGCESASSTIENPSCQDGLDNDGDGLVDFDGGVAALGGFATASADPHCDSFYDPAEKTPGSCGIGFELALIIGGLSQIRRRKRG